MACPHHHLSGAARGVDFPSLYVPMNREIGVSRPVALAKAISI